MGYQTGLSDIAQKEKHNFTIDTVNEDHNIEANTKAREIYLTYMFLRGADNLKYKQLKTDLRNNHIMGMDGYPQDLLGFMKLLNNYISSKWK